MGADNEVEIMDLSRKVIFAVCACAAFMTGIFSCTVEDRDVEEKELFVCREDADCLKGSICQGADISKGVEGRCVRIEQMDPCLDSDNDGYYVTAPNAPDGTNCSFGKGEDADDTNPTIYPGAPEFCDAKDNSGDGCIDGECQFPDCSTDSDCSSGGCFGAEVQKGIKGQCKGVCLGSDKSKCRRLFETCLGPVGSTIESLANTMCDPMKIGLRVCLPLNANNEIVDIAQSDHAGFVYVIPTGTDTYRKFDEQAIASLAEGERGQFYKTAGDASSGVITNCPKAEGYKGSIGGQMVPYSESEYADNTDSKTASMYAMYCSFDRDCNGIKGDGCEVCDPAKLSSSGCLVTERATVVAKTGRNSTRCDSAIANGQVCGCFGEYSCTDKNGQQGSGSSGFCNLTVNGTTYSFAVNDSGQNESERAQLALESNVFVNCGQ